MSSIRALKPLGFPWQTQDPFLFCVYHHDLYPEGNQHMGPAASLAGRSIGQDFAPNQPWRMYHGERVPGFPAHPHVGFETVTIVNEGVVDHSDSLGAAGRFGFGDVQWMTAGKGVQHCEMFPLLHQDKKNPLELFQIWLNLPRASKKANPYFSMLWGDTIPEVKTMDANQRATTVRVVAGRYVDTTAPAPPPDSWAAIADHEVAIWTINMEPGATWTLPAAGSSAVNRSLYFFKGDRVLVDDQRIQNPQAIELVADRDVVVTNGDAQGYFLLLQGKPINEPVVQYGPFVVNAQAEVQQVMAEYQRTQFGGWPWESFEHVHARSRSRFALYPDGREEVKPL